MRYTRLRMIGMLMGLLCSGASVAAQPARTDDPAVSPVVLQRVHEARVLMDRGEREEARMLLDSLARSVSPASPDLAEVLFWRATLAAGVADAERDWRQIVVEVPRSPRMPEVLLRLGDLAMLRKQPEEARQHFEQVLREFPDSPQHVSAVLWLARSHVAQRDLVSGCRVFAAHGQLASSDTELQAQADELSRQCGSVVPRAAPTPVRYAVQVGAFETEAEARDVVARLKQRSFDARIDGESKPFRVRIGRFETRGEATTLLNRMRAAGVEAFVAELTR